MNFINLSFLSLTLVFNFSMDIDLISVIFYFMDRSLGLLSKFKCFSTFHLIFHTILLNYKTSQ